MTKIAQILALISELDVVELSEVVEGLADQADGHAQAHEEIAHHWISVRDDFESAHASINALIDELNRS
jgi:predicted transcriptional regulator